MSSQTKKDIIIKLIGYQNWVLLHKTNVEFHFKFAESSKENEFLGDIVLEIHKH